VIQRFVFAVTSSEDRSNEIDTNPGEPINRLMLITLAEFDNPQTIFFLTTSTNLNALTRKLKETITDFSLLITNRF
jgi:hypothetical protein